MTRPQMTLAATLLATLLSGGCLPPPETPPASPPAASLRQESPSARDGPYVGSWVFVESGRGADAKGRQVAGHTEIWREGDTWLVEPLLPGQPRGKYAVPFTLKEGRLIRHSTEGKVTDEIRLVPSSGHILWRTAAGEVVEYRPR